MRKTANLFLSLKFHEIETVSTNECNKCGAAAASRSE